MTELKFKTNINCSGCLSKVTPILNAEKRIEKWNVDLNSEDRILSVKAVIVDVDTIKNLVRKAGFMAEEYSQNRV